MGTAAGRAEKRARKERDSDSFSWIFMCTWVSKRCSKYQSVENPVLLVD